MISKKIKNLKIATILPYKENYSFEKEIETMAPLYSNDVSRIKNMRIKILEALKNKHMMDDVKELLNNL